MSFIRILIIARPGANLDSLTAVLPAMVDNTELCFATETAEIQATLLNNPPHLAIIDSEIGYQEARLIYAHLTSHYPEARIIVLSDAAHWQRWKTINGSQQVLLKGFSTRRLKVTLSKALSGLTSFKAPSIL
jgi:DNA-binding NarL/FixJ family response regulator